MGALYFGVGKALGGLAGGLAIDQLGDRVTFRLFALLSFIAAAVYLLFNQLYKYDTFTLISGKNVNNWITY